VPADKDQIALTFMGLAFRYGFRRTSVEDVAKALRISKKTIYEAFPSKDTLLEYALELAALDQRRKVEARLTETTALGRALQVVRMALADARAGFAANPGVELVDPEMQAGVNDRVYGPMVRDLLEAGVAAGAFRITDVEQTSRFVMAIGMEAVRQIHDDPGSHPEEAAVEAVRRLIAGDAVQPAGGVTASDPAAPGQATLSSSGKKSKKKHKKK
jgi:AcrR family transcriptional regulator